MTTARRAHHLLRLLRREAKGWWYYRKLREDGQVEKAAGLERESMRSDLRMLRAAAAGGHFHVGRGGYSIEYRTGPDSTVSHQGYGGMRNGRVKAALICGVPGVNTMVIDDGHIMATLKLPLCVPGRDEPPRADGTWGGLMYAPLDVYLEMNRRLGAAVYNWRRP
jgi:hypothetical protein